MCIFAESQLYNFLYFRVKPMYIPYMFWILLLILRDENVLFNSTIRTRRCKHLNSEPKDLNFWTWYL